MSSKKGFTLIELLVVIAIIGILSAVVLASLNSARNKGADVSIKSTLANSRAQAELYYDGNRQSYEGLCEDETNGIKKMIDSVIAMNVIPAPSCQATSSAWALTSGLKTGGSWCVDSTGVSTSSQIDSFLCL